MIHPLDVALDACLKGDFNTSYDILDKMRDDPRALFNLGWHECRKGNLSKGMRLMDAGRFINVFGSPPIPGIIWRNEDLAGKVLLLRLEGGFGDQIHQVRFARDFAAKGARVVISCSHELAPFLSANGHTCVSSPAHLHYDYWMPGMSAAHVLGMEYSTVSGKPYLDAPATPLKGAFKVGVKWGGNPQFEHQQHRLFPSRLMTGLHDLPGTTFYSLQRDDYIIPDLPFEDLGPRMRTWQDTASLLKGLDLVISSCTSVAHLAGALGIPTWIVIPVLPYYLWAPPGTRTPWYDSVTLFRQQVYGNWDAPFKAIRATFSLSIKEAA